MFSLTRILKVAYLLILGSVVSLLSRPAPVRAQRTLAYAFLPSELTLIMSRTMLAAGMSSPFTSFMNVQMELMQASMPASMMMGGGMGMMGMGGGMMGMMGMGGMGMMGMGGMMMGGMSMMGGMMGMRGGMGMMGMGGGMMGTMMGGMGMGGFGMGGMGMGMRGFGGMGGFAGKGFGGFNGKKAL
jgi:hypothetical protein